MIPVLPKGWTWERGPGRVCRACETWAPWAELRARKPSSLGRESVCRPCDAARARRYYEKNLEAERERCRRYREENREAVRERERPRARRRREDPAYREAQREWSRRYYHEKVAGGGTCQGCGGSCDARCDRCHPCAVARLPGVYSLGVLAQNPDLALAPGRLYLVRLPFGLKYGITKADGASEREARYRSGEVVRQVETVTLFEAWAVEQAVKARQDLHRPTTEEEMEGAGGRTEVLWDTPEAEALVHRAMDALEGRQEALLDLAFELALATYEEAALGYCEDRWGGR